MTLTIADGKYVVTVQGKDDAGTLTLDAAKTPKTMVIKGVDGPNKDRTIPAIYELKGDTLKICYAMKGTNHPDKFESTKENGFFLAVYQRKK